MLTASGARQAPNGLVEIDTVAGRMKAATTWTPHLTVDGENLLDGVIEQDTFLGPSTAVASRPTQQRAREVTCAQCVQLA
jgi:hypothetical protein